MIAAPDTIMKLEAAALTDTGQQRPLNEDTVFQHTIQTDAGYYAGLYMVCDGLGGLSAGDEASRLAAQTLITELGPVLIKQKRAQRRNLTSPTTATLYRWLESAVAKANSNIVNYIKRLPLVTGKAGTTVTMALVYGYLALIVNVGDSRTYGWRRGRLTQITHDHSWAAEMVEYGMLEPEMQSQHRWRNILTRALGIEKKVSPDIFEWELQPGDKLLLCSDGLWQAFPDEQELASRLGREAAAEDICWDLVAEANKRDGSDNISVVLVSAEPA